MWCLHVGWGRVALFPSTNALTLLLMSDGLAKIFRANLVMCLAHTSIAFANMNLVFSKVHRI